MRTLGFSIASKRAQDHRIRSPYAQVIDVLVGCCWLSWGSREHGVFDPRAHGVSRILGTPCTRARTVHTGSQPPCARGAQEMPVGAPTASFGVWLFKGPFLPPVGGWFTHILNTILIPSPPLPNPYLPSM